MDFVKGGALRHPLYLYPGASGGKMGGFLKAGESLSGWCVFPAYGIAPYGGWLLFTASLWQEQSAWKSPAKAGDSGDVYLAGGCDCGGGGFLSSDVPDSERRIGAGGAEPDLCSKNPWNVRGQNFYAGSSSCGVAGYCSGDDSGVCQSAGRIWRNDYAGGKYSRKNPDDVCGGVYRGAERGQSPCLSLGGSDYADFLYHDFSDELLDGISGAAQTERRCKKACHSTSTLKKTAVISA